MDHCKEPREDFTSSTKRKRADEDWLQSLECESPPLYISGDFNSDIGRQYPKKLPFFIRLPYPLDVEGPGRIDEANAVVFNDQSLKLTEQKLLYQGKEEDKENIPPPRACPEKTDQVETAEDGNIFEQSSQINLFFLESDEESFEDFDESGSQNNQNASQNRKKEDRIVLQEWFTDPVSRLGGLVSQHCLIFRRHFRRRLFSDSINRSLFKRRRSVSS